MTLELSLQESNLLCRLLERELNELPSEIRRTQTSSFRDDLKAEEQTLRRLHDRIVETCKTA